MLLLVVKTGVYVCVRGSWGWQLFVYICEMIQSFDQAVHFDLISQEITAIITTINKQMHQQNTAVLAVKSLTHHA